MSEAPSNTVVTESATTGTGDIGRQEPSRAAMLDGTNLPHLVWIRTEEDVAIATAAEGVFKLQRHFDKNYSLFVPWDCPAGSVVAGFGADVKRLMEIAELHRRGSIYMKQRRGEQS